MKKSWMAFLMFILLAFLIIPSFFIKDCFVSLNVSFKGNNGFGYVDIETNDLTYLDFDIVPNEDLSNGDEVLITVKNSKGELLKHGLILKNKEKKYIVSGLKEVDYTYPYEEQNIDSSDLDKKEYEEYWNKQVCVDCNDGAVEISEDEKENGTAPVTQEWKKGTSKKVTKKKDKDFFTVEYGNNSIETFKTANSYGLDSSQEYKVEPITSPRGQVIGYSCIFNH